MEKSDRSRRDTLKWLLTGMGVALGAILSAGFIGKVLSPRRKGQKGKSLLTLRKADLPLRGALVYRERRVAVVREDENIHALSLVCTHLGCTVTASPREFVCPCHGSRFDKQGVPLVGPATEPLPRHPLEHSGDSLVVLS
ncbi:MAG: hypothetical protein A2X94_02785 [Bdellovibrionales bacterium GWB1_55_8]|nr:MAG: hypothetical protein A2X94_02785 [Bdellovibrionales bacterium GWB1_55_8]